ncbi:hypothetical protein OZ410_11930 [Robiginitalea sp. M366]|nr:hypothetical protein [Robiginitalea aestuariiviva]MDG1573029.1 hypothetical protein [Robiginitalea aestuariiviva]
MEQLYTKTSPQCKLVTASEETVRFLLDYSKSLSIVEADGMTIENNLN